MKRKWWALSFLAIGLSALLVIAEFGNLYPSATEPQTTVTVTQTSTVTQIQTVTDEEYGCVTEVLGLSIQTFENGTQAWVPQYSCLPKASPYYSAVSAVVGDSRFLALENGTAFTFYNGDGAVASSTNLTNGQVTDQFLFNRYFSNETFGGCEAQALVTSLIADQIYAEVPKFYNGSYDTSNATIGVTPSFLLNQSTIFCNLGPAVQPFWLIPEHFNYDQYSFKMVYNGTGYQHPGNLTADPDYNMVFVIAAGDYPRQTVDVRWDTPYPMGGPYLPSLSSYVAQIDGQVNMTWWVKVLRPGVEQLYLNVTDG